MAEETLVSTGVQKQPSKPRWLRILLATLASITGSVIITVTINFLVMGEMVDVAIGIAIAIAVPLIIVPIATFQVFSLMDKLAEANAQLVATNQLDPLTGILNRSAFFEVAENQIQLAMRHNIKLALLMVDFDDFKAVNDNHGHRAGDAVLIRSVKEMQLALRDSDLFARYGGEEFVILLTYANNPLDVAERTREAVANIRIAADRTNISPTVSVGSATWIKGEPLMALIERADKALYVAKSQGKNQVVAAE